MKPDRKTIMVTGAFGYLGNLVVHHAASKYTDGKPHNIIAVDSFAGAKADEWSERRLAMGRANVFGLGHRIVQRDLGDVLNSYSANQVDAVIHLAAYVGEPECDRVGKEETYHVNYQLVEKLLDWCRRASRPPHLVFASTCSNYGTVTPGTKATLETPLRPLGIYAETKVAAEAMLWDSGYKRLTIARLGTLMGYSPAMRYDLMVAEAGMCAARGLDFEVNDPDAWRPFTHVRDAAKALGYHTQNALRAEGLRVKANLVGFNVQKRQIGDLYERATGKRAKVNALQKDKRNYAVEEQTGRELGLKPWGTLEMAFREGYEYAKALAGKL